MGWYGGYAPYVSVAERRLQAEKEAAKLAKKGRILAPVQPTGRAIATTVWGKAWCDHLEQHGDYANRLPRGRTYARNGSVIDLQVRAGEVTALVSGSSIYSVRVAIQPLPPAPWQVLASDCAGRIESLVELLQGRLDKGVLLRLCHPRDGLFPQPRQMTFACSCPDGASMCKHVAATLYGVGHRLDTAPELLFVLRQVDQRDLVRQATAGPVLHATAAPTLDADDLAAVFGLELEADRGPLPAIAALRPVPVPHLPAVPARPPRVPGRKPVRPAGKAAGPQRNPVPVKAKRVRTPPAPVETAQGYALRVLREFPEQECTVAELYDWQVQPDHGRAQLQAALVALLAKGQVERCGTPGAVVAWAIAR